MEIIEIVVLVVHVLSALAIVGLVLLQQGKGAEMGSGFGAGASATVFGSAGSGNFLTRSTTAATLVFFLTSFGLAYVATERAAAVAEIGLPQLPETTLIDDGASAESEIPLTADGVPAEFEAGEVPVLEPSAGDDESGPAP